MLFSSQILLTSHVANKGHENRMEIVLEQVMIDVGHDEIKLVCSTPDPNKIGPSGIVQEDELIDVQSSHVPRSIDRNVDQGLSSLNESYPTPSRPCRTLITTCDARS